MAEKRNVTLKLDEKVLTDARILAAERGSSVSRLLTEKLADLVASAKGYDRARKRAVARLCTGLDLGWKRPQSRDELHER